MQRDLEEENRTLRERIVQLEQALASGVDPILRALSEHAASYLSVLTPKGRFLAVGRPSEAFGSVVGRSVFEFVEPSSAERMREVLARVVQTRQPERYESVGYGEDGTLGHTYLTRAIPLCEGDDVHAIVLVPMDITDHVRLERSLADKEESLRFAIEASRMGLWSWDLATDEIVWNDRLREIFETEGTPQNYQPYLELVHPDDHQLVQHTVEQALESGVFATFEHRLAPRGTRGERWVLAAGTVVKNSDGKNIRLMGGAFDITEQKRLALQNQRAERVESIGQLTAGMAHNFNNLLAVIMPNLEMELARNKQNVALTAALDASLQARDLVKNLLSLTRRDDSVSEGRADLLAVVARVMNICRATFPREIELRNEVRAGLGHVSMAPSVLQQVLLNLLFNARDAILASSGTQREIIVSAERLLAEGHAGVIELHVRDTGIGMSDAVRARVFEPFFTTKPPLKGSGLGLASAAERVREAGGTLRCESTPNIGTKFALQLSQLNPPTANTTAPPALEQPSLANETLLLVDDEPLVRSVLRRLLEQDGYRILEAASADDARAVLKRGLKVDLLILDQSMPGETGTQAQPSLRALTAAPMLLFTGMAPELPQGFAGILEKPARYEELQRVVRQALAERGPE